MQLANLDIAADYTVNNELDINIILVDSSILAITIDLPVAPLEGLFLYIKDKGNASVNNITIDGNGITIEGAATTTINTNYGYKEVYFCQTSNSWFLL